VGLGLLTTCMYSSDVSGGDDCPSSNCTCMLDEKKLTVVLF